MKIEISEDDLHAAVTTSTQKAVSSALESYQIESAIRERVCDSVLSSAIAETVMDSLTSIDLEALHKALAEEISRTITGAACHLIRDATIELMLNMRGVPKYDDEKMAAARRDIEAKLILGKKQAM